MKKVLSILLSLCLCAGMLIGPMGATAFADTPTVTPSAAAQTIKVAFADDIKAEYAPTAEEVEGLPVLLTAYRRSQVEANGCAILYVVGSAAVRAGTDSDVSIVDDLLNEGYIVTVADYLDNPAAAGTDLGTYVQLLLGNGMATGKYVGGQPLVGKHVYMVPSGCRIVRGVNFFWLDTMAPYGVNEYIVETYNMYYAGKKKDNNGHYLQPATSVETCLKKDGTPINMELTMDIIYPANPDRTVPCFALASSSETYYTSIANPIRPYFSQALLDGYAAFLYEHEYIPMSRDDHFGYLDDRFTLLNYTANRVHSAAIRRIRYLADTYGYDAEYLSVFGFSKSSMGPAILSDVNHEQKGEAMTLDAYCPEGKSCTDSPAPQPWLTYEGTDIPISSNVTAVYSGAGPGIIQYRQFSINNNSVPVFASIGTKDETAGFRWQIGNVSAFFDRLDIESCFVSLTDIPHDPAHGYDSDREADMFKVAWTFLDNHVRAAYRQESPRVLWMTPQNGKYFDDDSVPVFIKFSRAMNPDSLNKGIRIERLSDGKVISGEWIGHHGNTDFTFTSAQMIPGSAYRVTVTGDCKAADGVGMDAPFTKTFALSGDVALSADKNAVITTDGMLDAANGLTVTGENKKDMSFVSFNRQDGFADVTRATLILDCTGKDAIQIQVYGLKDDTFSRTAEADLLSGASTDGNVCLFDVTDYVKNRPDGTAAFRLSSTSTSKTAYDNNFESASGSNFALNSQYRFGGGNMTLSFADAGHDSQKSIYLSNRKSDTRIKLLNTLGKRHITLEDLGAVYKASLWIKPDRDCDLKVGLYAESGTAGYSGYDMKSYHAPAGVWTRLDYSACIDRTMVSVDACHLTVEVTNDTNFYLDDVKVWQEGGSTCLASKEQAATDEARMAPTLVLYTPQNTQVSSMGLSVIASGSKADEVIVTDNPVICGMQKEDLSDTRKGLIQFPIDSLLADDTATLTFKATADAPQKVAVYGLLENTDASVTWNTAYGNDKTGSGVLAQSVYDETALATVSIDEGDTFNVSVTDYVKAMKAKGELAVTFLLVAENQGKEAYQSFNSLDDYDGYTTSWALKSAYKRGICADPTDPDNRVFYFEKSGTQAGDNGYYQTVSFTGFLGTNGKWTTADIGDSYTVSFRQYNEAPANCGIYGCLGTAGSTEFSNTLVSKKVVSDDPSIATNVPGHWTTVSYTFTVTADMVESKSAYTAIVVGSGWTATKVYVDDIKVTKQVGTVHVDVTEDSKPSLQITHTAGGHETVACTLAATLSGGTPDAAITPNDTMPLSQTVLRGAGEGLKKVYVTFNQSGLNHVQSGQAVIALKQAAPGKTLYVYGLKSGVNTDGLTWNNALGNLSGNALDAATVFGGKPLATLQLTDSLTYRVDLEEWAVALRGQDYITLVLCAPDKQDEVALSDIRVTLKHAPADFTKTTVRIDLPGNSATVPSGQPTVLSATVAHALGQTVERVVFTLDGEEVKIPLMACGESYRLCLNDLSDGQHTVSAAFTVNGETVTSKPTTFMVATYAVGDVNHDGTVDTVDLVTLKKLLAGLTDQSAVPGADVDGNGTVDTVDLVTLKKQLAGLL